jgi:hypothetical protein
MEAGSGSVGQPRVRGRLTHAETWVATRNLSPPPMAGRCAAAEDVLPPVSGTRRLRQDTHVLLGVEAIRPGYVAVRQFTDQRKPVGWNQVPRRG